MGVVYMAGAVCLLVYLTYRYRRHHIRAALLGITAVACAISLLGWVVSVHEAETHIAGLVFAGGGVGSLALYYTPDAMKRLR